MHSYVILSETTRVYVHVCRVEGQFFNYHNESGSTTTDIDELCRTMLAAESNGKKTPGDVTAVSSTYVMQYRSNRCL